MNNDKLKKIIIISTISALVIIGVGVGTYKYNKIQAYNNLINNANKYMDQRDYDQAIALFNQSTQYKNDPNIQSSIKLAQSLKEVKGVFDEGVKLMSDKKYLEAMNQFQRVTKEDNKLYSDTQKKIEECKKQLIALSNDEIKDNKFDEANKYLDEILKIDANNADAKKLKDTVTKAIKDQQEKAKVVEKAKVTEAASNNVTQEQAITILNNMGLDDMEIRGKGQLSSTEFVVDGENIYGHECYYIGGKGGNGIQFVLDANTGKLYESQGKGSDSRRMLQLKR